MQYENNWLAIVATEGGESRMSQSAGSLSILDMARKEVPPASSERIATL